MLVVKTDRDTKTKTEAKKKAHCDHKPRVAWVFVRLLLHRRSAAGWAECMIYSAHSRVICVASVAFFPAALALTKARSPI